MYTDVNTTLQCMHKHNIVQCVHIHTLYLTNNTIEPGHVCQFSGTRFSQDWQVFVVVVAGCRAVESGIVNQLAFHISVHQGSLGYCMVYQSSQWPLL